MNQLKLIAILGLTVASLSGCMRSADQSERPEAVTLGAGNAQAANTVMQIVDPWPAGVDNTNIKTPADLEQYQPDEEDQEDADGIATSDISG